MWKKEISLDILNTRYNRPHIGQYLEIAFTEVGEDYLVATMPVNSKVHQPYGLLHGGVSVVLAETLGSVAGDFCVPEGYSVVGLEVNANHLRPVREGLVQGVCTSIKLGGKIQVWDIKLYTEAKELFCISRLTTAVVKL